MTHDSPNPAPAPFRVLVCDDEVSIRAVVERRLRAAGFEVAAARDGEAALELVASFGPHVVVTDHRMPKLSGVAFARRLAESPENDGVAVILLTAQAHTISDDEFEGARIRRVIEKPFSPVRLVKAVEELATRGIDRGAAADEAERAA